MLSRSVFRQSKNVALCSTRAFSTARPQLKQQQTVPDTLDHVNSVTPAEIVSGAPEEISINRIVRIYQAAKPATQSGTWGKLRHILFLLLLLFFQCYITNYLIYLFIYYFQEPVLGRLTGILLNVPTVGKTTSWVTHHLVTTCKLLKSSFLPKKLLSDLLPTKAGTTMSKNLTLASSVQRAMRQTLSTLLVH